MMTKLSQFKIGCGMKKNFYSLFFIASLLGSAAVNATNLWTADIDNIYVYSDGRAKNFLENLSNPNPSNENQTSTECTSNGVWLAANVSALKAGPELVSFSLTMFASKTPVRIAIIGQGADCYIINVGSQS